MGQPYVELFECLFFAILFGIGYSGFNKRNEFFRSGGEVSDAFAALRDLFSGRVA